MPSSNSASASSPSATQKLINQWLEKMKKTTRGTRGNPPARQCCSQACCACCCRRCRQTRSSHRCNRRVNLLLSRLRPRASKLRWLNRPPSPPPIFRCSQARGGIFRAQVRRPRLPKLQQRRRHARADLRLDRGGPHASAHPHASRQSSSRALDPDPLSRQELP